MNVPLEVRVWGDHACFTRPEMKVERVSYPVMTPSAARGFLEAVFWKPEFTWQVREIAVMRPIRFTSLLRNEVDRRMSHRTDEMWITDSRTQRHTLALKDVEYVVRADMVLKPEVDSDPAKYRDQFRRRVTKGRCFHRPYLGCREFAAHFDDVGERSRPIPLNERLGSMLLDIEYGGDAGNTPHFFDAELRDGILYVPQYDFNRKGVQRASTETRG